jgi:uroporphyrinogen decarboxylase
MLRKMSPRERVLTALNHEEPDRVPMALWGSYYSLQDQTYFRLLQHLGAGKPTPPFRRYRPRNSNHMDDRVLDLLGTDIRYVWLGFTDLGGAHPDTMTDAWGVRWKRMGDYITPASTPLANATIEEVSEYAWPNAEQYVRTDELRDRVAALKKSGRHAIAARAVNSYGPLEQASVLRGRQQFLVDLLLEPELAKLLITKVTDVLVHLQELYLDTVGHDIDILETPGDDYGGSKNLLISPAAFDSTVKPALQRMFRPVKQFREDLVLAFHSDGAIVRLLPTLIDLGVDLLHPLEPLEANDMKAIKKEFGDRLSFMGAIDIKQAMPGRPKDVEAEVKLRVRQLAPGGGYILAPANHLQTDVPPQNIVALYDYGREHGHYPLAA